MVDCCTINAALLFSYFRHFKIVKHSTIVLVRALFKITNTPAF